MPRPKVLITHSLFEPARKALDEKCDTEYWTAATHIPRAELLMRVADKDALICLLTEKVDEELLSKAPRLRIAATVSVGYDNLDISACTHHKVAATNTPGVLDDTTADTAWMIMMAAARRLSEAETWLRSGTWPGWDLDQLCGADIWGKTLGIVGFGRIGREMARRAKGFRMRTLYHDAARVGSEIESKLAAEFVSFERILFESDFITLHVPLTAQTHHLFGTKTFAQMKPTAYVVNTSRGPVVDEAALLEAIKSGKIAGAALDVFEFEPKVSPELLALKNVVVTPHIGSASLETRTKMALVAADNVIALFEGRRPPTLINPEVLAGQTATSS
jgi:lactate dehydrogenase-like 2-hydroxyacid dehydrogenase